MIGRFRAAVGRRKNEDWRIGGDHFRTDEAQLAVLMDIRDELQDLNIRVKLSNAYANDTHTFMRSFMVELQKRTRQAKARGKK